MKASLTVFFEDPFWVGVFERIEDGKLSVCKVTFGAEPKDYEVWDYILHHYYELVFSPAIEIQTRQAADNPKRRSRNARKHLENTGIGTKSQQALQRQREEMKKERRQVSREEREAEAQRRYRRRKRKRNGDIDGKRNNDLQNGSQYSLAVLSGVFACILCILHNGRVV